MEEKIDHGQAPTRPCATPINPTYSGAVFRSCPPGPNTSTL